MNIDDCANGHCMGSGWKYALGGAAVGFVAVHMMNRGSMRRNPHGGLTLEVDGNTYYVRQFGMTGAYSVWAQRPNSQQEDYIGVAEKGPKGSFRVFPEAIYETLGVDSNAPSFMTDKGVLAKTLRKAVGVLGRPYHRAYKRSRYYKEHLGRRFSSALR